MCEVVWKGESGTRGVVRLVRSLRRRRGGRLAMEGGPDMQLGPICLSLSVITEPAHAVVITTREVDAASGVYSCSGRTGSVDSG